MVRILHHKFILFAISLLFLGVAAVPNVKLAAADTDQALRDLNDLNGEAENLRRDARNFEVPESYLDNPISGDREADFESLGQMQEQARGQNERLKELRKQLEKDRLGSSEIQRQINQVQQHINVTSSLIIEKMKKINDVHYKDGKKKAKDAGRTTSTGRTTGTGDTGAGTTSAVGAGTEESAIEIPDAKFVAVKIPEIPAGPVCPEDKDALIDAAFEGESAAGDNARAAQSVVLAISRALSDGKGDPAALNEQLEAAQDVVKKRDEEWDKAEKARLAAQNLTTKDCSKVGDAAGAPAPVSERAALSRSGEVREVEIAEIPDGPVCPEEKHALIMQATEALSNALHNMQIALKNNEGLKKWADEKNKAEDAQKRALELKTKDCDEKEDDKKSSYNRWLKNFLKEYYGGVYQDKSENAPGLKIGLGLDDSNGCDPQTGKVTGKNYAGGSNVQTKTGESSALFIASNDKRKEAVKIRNKAEYHRELADKYRAKAEDDRYIRYRESYLRIAAGHDKDAERLKNEAENLAKEAEKLENEAKETEKAARESAAAESASQSLEELDPEFIYRGFSLENIDDWISFWRAKAKEAFEKAESAPFGSDEQEVAGKDFHDAMQNIERLKNLRSKVEEAKKKAKKDKTPSVFEQIDEAAKKGDFNISFGIYLRAVEMALEKKLHEGNLSSPGKDDDDEKPGANVPMEGLNDAIQRGINQFLEGRPPIPSFGPPNLEWSNLSPGTDPLQTVSVSECNIVWTAQAGPSKSLPAVGVEDQWATKAIDWNPSLASSEGSAIVAVIDSGVDYNNIQLKDAIWKNLAEKLNGIDDDGNGYIDDIQGWNFIADNNDPLDDYGHGTMTAGIIAARPINGKGIFGVNPRAKIMNLKVIDEAGNVGTRDVARAIYYATHHGAKVINLSLGGRTPSFIVDAAIGYARRKGALVVVAAGNDALDTGQYSSGSIGALTVAATDKENKRLGISNWGHEVDIAAPGLDVLSLRAKDTDMLLQTGAFPYVIGDREYWPWKKESQGGEEKEYLPGKNIFKVDYYHATGTSFAAPFVSGVASLIFSKNPELTAEQATRMLLMSADDIELPGWDQLTGYGLLNAKKGLEADPDYYTIARIDKIAAVKKSGKVIIQIIGTAASSEFKEAWVELGFGESPEKWKQIGKKIKKEVKQGLLAEINPKEFNKKGKWSVRVIAKTEKHGNKESWGSMNIK